VTDFRGVDVQQGTRPRRIKADRRSFEERLVSRYEVDLDTGCWLWTGTLTWGGYGQIGGRGTNFAAHRAMWEHKRGPIPEGMVIDHLCLTRRCVNPDHLEIVTYSENNLRRFRHREPLRTPSL
jgi:hypothetical protein